MLTFTLKSELVINKPDKFQRINIVLFVPSFLSYINTPLSINTPKGQLSFEIFVYKSRERVERERGRMSGGIARGRLAEERKSWRKNHPHV